MGLSERHLENKIKDLLESRGAWVIKTQGGGVPAGTPDLLAVYEGYFLGLEIKHPNGRGRVTFIQKKHLQAIAEAGGIGCVAQSLDVVEKLLDACASGSFNNFDCVDPNKALYDDAWLAEDLWKKR